MLYRAMGDHAAALPLYRQALEIIRTALGEDHPDYATSLNNLAMLYAATGRASEAMPLMEQAAAIDDRMIGQILAIGSERQRAAFLNTVLGQASWLFVPGSATPRRFPQCNPRCFRAGAAEEGHRGRGSGHAARRPAGGQVSCSGTPAARARRPADADRSQDARGSWT